MTDLRPYAQLVRLPNLPTAVADVALAALATQSLPGRWPAFLILVGASCCLYMAGMVLNDFFDVEQDRLERPDRPIPSGRVSRRAAGRLGAGLLGAGVGLAFLAGWVMVLREEAAGPFRPAVIAGVLAVAILAYDGWLKRTALGPVAMGSCRFLNVLLGVSLAGSSAWPLGPYLALVVGLYIVGVTWFARTEARASRQAALAGAAGVMLASLALVLAAAVQEAGPRRLAEEGQASPLFPYLLVALGFWLGFPLWRAITAPTPPHVQSAVKRSLMGLILLDTVLATGTAGTVGLALLVLLAPSVYLNRRRWLYAT
jgi:4-hydroxybenzoate polyprenyltransferase